MSLQPHQIDHVALQLNSYRTVDSITRQCIRCIREDFIIWRLTTACSLRIWSLWQLALL
jgi:hypothetical protein